MADQFQFQNVESMSREQCAAEAATLKTRVAILLIEREKARADLEDMLAKGRKLDIEVKVTEEMVNAYTEYNTQMAKIAVSIQKETASFEEETVADLEWMRSLGLGDVQEGARVDWETRVSMSNSLLQEEVAAINDDRATFTKKILDMHVQMRNLTQTCLRDLAAAKEKLEGEGIVVAGGALEKMAAFIGEAMGSGSVHGRVLEGSIAYIRSLVDQRLPGYGEGDAPPAYDG
ncbi:hypothetical protein Vi05172_g9173 [Venturia inaequalis]|nr:hypothetical protein Vi05172_g9173 [Venturia inaequalis]